MNKIKPQWVVVGFVVVGALWLTETSNRPDSISRHSSELDHHINLEMSNAVIPHGSATPPPVDPLSLVDQQVAEKKIRQPLTARMMVANRGEFFAVQATALPAQEQALLVDMGQQKALANKSGRADESCGYKSCIGQDASDY